jgi:hypothetical protein
LAVSVTGIGVLDGRGGNPRLLVGHGSHVVSELLVFDSEAVEFSPHHLHLCLHVVIVVL